MIIMFMSSDRIVSGQTTVILLATAENIFLAPPKCIGALVILVTRKVNKCVFSKSRSIKVLAINIVLAVDPGTANDLLSL